MEAGIVGLPNVGKSTLFNALTSSQSAQSENYPFCTIEPNEGIVNVPDDRLQRTIFGIDRTCKLRSYQHEQRRRRVDRQEEEEAEPRQLAVQQLEPRRVGAVPG